MNLKTIRTLCYIWVCFTSTLFANDSKYTLNGDAYFRGYQIDPSTKSQGFAQRVRLKLNVNIDEKTKIATSAILSGDKWNGDTADQKITGNSDNGAGGNPIRLDYAYLDTQLENKITLRVGRTTANFSDCFNTCDDRRDRLLLMKFYGKYLPVILFDKRAEGDINNEQDDRDMLAAALFHIDKTHEWALLYATWLSENDADVLKKVHNFSPYYKYQKDKIMMMFIYNYLGQGKDTSWFNDHHHSFAIKSQYAFSDRFFIAAQIIGTIDGGLIASGYDTYSMAVNNSPDHNQSNNKLVSLGGLGTFTGGEVDDEYMMITRFGFKPNQNHLLTFNIARAKETISQQKNLLNIFDLQYQRTLSKNLLFKTGVALIRDDRHENTGLFELETRF